MWTLVWSGEFTCSRFIYLGALADMQITSLMMSYAVSVTGSLNWVVRSASEVETNIVSVSGQSVSSPPRSSAHFSRTCYQVERVMAYGDLASEAPDEVPEKKPVAAWPQQGAIQFSQSFSRISV